MESLLEAIANDPDDDATRLVYSDWLEERGDTLRAEQLRTEVALIATEADLARTPPPSTTSHAVIAMPHAFVNIGDRWRAQDAIVCVASVGREYQHFDAGRAMVQALQTPEGIEQIVRQDLDPRLAERLGSRLRPFLDVEVRGPAPADPRVRAYVAAWRRLDELDRVLDPAWLARVERPRTILLESVPPETFIATIRNLRCVGPLARRLGLGEAKAIVDGARANGSHVVIDRIDARHVALALDHFRDVAPLRVTRSGATRA